MNPQLSETVLVTGAGEGVGLPAMQLAKSAGARVIAVTGSEPKKAGLIEDRGDDTVVAPSGKIFQKYRRALTRNERVDMVNRYGWQTGV